MTSRVKRAGQCWLTATLCVLSTAASPGGTDHHADHAHPPAGVVALDVFAHDAAIDLLIVEQRGKTHELVHRRSVDGGVSWSAPHPIDRGGRAVAGPHRGMDPQIAAAGDTLVALWTTTGTSEWGDGPLVTATSRDAGRTWTPGPNPADDGTTESHAFLELTADPGGRLSAFWLDSRDGAQGLRTSSSVDGGRTWTKNDTLDARTCECCWNKALAVGPGQAFLLYRDKDPRDMALASTSDGGRTWTRRAIVGAFNWQFDGCPHVGGGIAESRAADRRYLHAVVWTGAEGREGLYALRSADDGVRWSTPTRLASARAKNADVAALGTHVMAVWDETGEGQPAIVAARSRDHGATWDPPKRIAAASQASHPLVVASGGRFVAFWTEKTRQGRLTWKSVALDPNAGVLPRGSQAR